MTDDLRKEIGKRVEDIRLTETKKTKRDFSKLLGITEQQLGRIESGKSGISIDKLIFLCRNFNLSADYILFGKESRSVEQTIREVVLEELMKHKGKELAIVTTIVTSILNRL